MSSAPATRIDEDARNEAGALCKLRSRLIKGRKWVVGTKIFAMVLFIAAWTLLQIHEYTWAGSTLLGGSFWTDFAVYTAVAVSFPIFSVIGNIRKGCLVSHVWFEVTWLLGVGGFDIFLIQRMKHRWAPFRFWEDLVSNDPFIMISLMLYILAVIALGLDLILSFLWSVLLLKLCAERFRGRHSILLLYAADFLWLQSSNGDNHTPPIKKLLLGSPGPHRDLTSVLAALWRWTMDLNAFKNSGGVETTVSCFIRGCSGLIIWAIILGYGIMNSLINPAAQFNRSPGLPMRPLTEDWLDTSLRGNIQGYIIVDVVQAPSNRSVLDIGIMPQPICDAIGNGMNATYTNPLSQQVMECSLFCNINPFWGGDAVYEEHTIEWDCGSIWDNIPFREGASTMDTAPFISVKWNSSSLLPRPPQVFTSGFSSILTRTSSGNTTLLWQSALKSTSTPRETPIRGNTFKFIAGRVVHIEVGRRQIYMREGTFRELLGFSESPNVFVTYPLAVVRSEGISLDPQITSLTFYPTFGPYTDDIYEQYLTHTVLGGLSKTGGLYTAFDLTFALLFGRSLISILWGGKFTTPFGALGSWVRADRFRKKLCNAYAGIESSDPGKRAEATCNFLHDFILDLTPLKIKQTSEMEESESVGAQEDEKSKNADTQAGPTQGTQGPGDPKL